MSSPGRERTRLIAAGLYLVFAVVAWLRYDRTVAGGDIGLYLDQPVRLLHGDLPYRDFWMLYPPGIVYAPYLVYRFVAFSVNAVLVVSLLVTALIGPLTFMVARAIGASARVATLTAVLVVWCGVPAWYIGPTYLHAQLLLALCASFMIVRYADRGAAARLFVAGSCLGVAGLFRIFETGAVGVAASIAVVMIERAARASWRRVAGRLALLVLGGALPPLAFALAMPSIVRPMFRETGGAVEAIASAGASLFAGVARKLGPLAVEAARARATMDPASIARVVWDSAIVAGVTAHYAFPLLAIAIVVCLIRARAWSARENAIAALFGVWALLHLPKATIGSSEMSHWVHLTTPLFFVFALVWRASAAPGRAAHVLAIAAMAGVLLPVPLALAQSVREATRAHVTIAAAHGRLAPTDLALGRATAEVVAMIQARTREGDAIFVVPPDAPAFWALTGRRNPTRYDSILDLHLRPSPDKQAAICADLRRHDAKLVIHYGREDSPWRASFEPSNPVLSRCIRESFREVASVGPFAVWEKAGAGGGS